MPLFFAISPGLTVIGALLLAIGLLGLFAGCRELRRMALSGAFVFAIGALPQVAVYGLPGMAHASDHAAAGPMQEILLAGMGSDIVYTTD